MYYFYYFPYNYKNRVLACFQTRPNEGCMGRSLKVPRHGNPKSNFIYFGKMSLNIEFYFLRSNIWVAIFTSCVCVCVCVCFHFDCTTAQATFPLGRIKQLQFLQPQRVVFPLGCKTQLLFSVYLSPSMRESDWWSRCAHSVVETAP